MSEMKCVPELRFSNFEGGWSCIALGQLLEFKNGINASKEQYGSGKKFINVLDIIKNEFITHDRIIGSVNITESEFEKNIVSYGDVLFQRSSETREEVGQSNIYLDQLKNATFGGFVIRGKKIGDYYPKFLNLSLKTPFVRKEMTSRSGGSTRYNIGQESLSKVQVYLPSVEEQQKIAHFLSSVDQKIQQLTEKHRLLTDYKKGVMQQIFTQQIRFKDDQGNDYPEWKKLPLKEIASFFSGGTPKSSNKSFYIGDIPFIKSGEINSEKTEQFISQKALESSSAKMVEVGDLLYALYGATSGEVAVCKINGAINQAVLCIRTDENINYLFNWLRFSKDRILSTYLQGGQGNLSAQIIKELQAPIPSIDEQTKIADFLTAIDQKIQQTQTTLNQTQAFKNGLFQKMFV